MLWLKVSKVGTQKYRGHIASWSREITGCNLCFEAVALTDVWEIESRGLGGEAGKQHFCHGLRKG